MTVKYSTVFSIAASGNPQMYIFQSTILISTIIQSHYSNSPLELPYNYILTNLNLAKPKFFTVRKYTPGGNTEYWVFDI
jgi:hypothetical protein